MNIFSYLLPRPTIKKSTKKRVAFEELFRSIPVGGFVDYQLPYPKWQFLSYVCEAKDLVLHGSQNGDIDEVEPRQAIDVKAFSKQQAIYATTDGIWVIYFAIVDRKKYGMSLFNSCLQVRILPGLLTNPFYFFSITQSALVQQPWCEGTVYVLPRQTFEREPAQKAMGFKIIFPHWVSPQPVKPLMKLKVNAQDFPFLAKVHGHNDEKLNQLFVSDPNGFPWPAALES
jgi:hypothetical protein